MLAEPALQPGWARGTRKSIVDFVRADFVLINRMLSVDWKMELANCASMNEKYKHLVTIAHAAIDDSVPRRYIARTKKAVYPRCLV